MQQRYYDPVTGRFYSNDPVGFSADNPMLFNRYAYSNNNPYKYIDPDGRAAIVTLYKGQGPNVLGHVGIGTTTGENANKTFGKGPNEGEGVGLIESVPGHVTIDTNTPIATITISTTPEQDAAINKFNEASAASTSTEYKLTESSCVDYVRSGLAAGGIEIPTPTGTGQMSRVPNTSGKATNLPTTLFNALKPLGKVTSN